MLAVKYLQREAAGGRREAFDRYVQAVPDVEPMVGDRIECALHARSSRADPTALVGRNDPEPGYNLVMASAVVHIGDVIGHGIVFDPRNSGRLQDMDFNELVASIPRLFDLLDERGVQYVLVGGIAMRVHAPGRNTQDIDLIVPADALDRVPEIKVLDRNDSFARAEFGRLQIDFLLGDHRLFDLVRSRHARRERFVEREIVCATVEGLLLLKLFALPSLYRQGKFSRVEDYEHDIAVLLREHRPDMDAIYAELAGHLSATDLSEVRAIVADIEKRIADSRRRFGGR